MGFAEKSTFRLACKEKDTTWCEESFGFSGTTVHECNALLTPSVVRSCITLWIKLSTGSAVTMSLVPWDVGTKRVGQRESKKSAKWHHTFLRALPVVLIRLQYCKTCRKQESKEGEECQVWTWKTVTIDGKREWCAVSLWKTTTGWVWLGLP